MDPVIHLQKKMQALKIDRYEIYQRKLHQRSVEAKEGIIDGVDEAIEQGLALRVFRGPRQGFVFTSDWTIPVLDRALDLAYNMLAVVEDGPSISLPAENFSKGAKKEGLSLSPVAQSHQMALDLERYAKAFDRRVQRVREASVSEEIMTVRVCNSSGLDQVATRKNCEIALMVVAEEGGVQEMAWDSEFASECDRLDPRVLAEKTAEKALWQLGGKPIATQKTDALLDPFVLCSFLGVLSHSFFADQIQLKRSALVGRMGESIYASGITIVDDGNLEEGFSSFPFDAEGVATQKNILVQSGRLEKFLYDLKSGTREQRSSTGNGIRAGLKEPPRVGTTNFFIESDPKGKEEEKLISTLGRGFWVRDVIGVHTVDAVTGDFSLGASGQWVEKGQRASAVRGVTISGNLHQLLKSVSMVGNKIRFYRNYGAPSLIVQGLDVGGL